MSDARHPSFRKGSNGRGLSLRSIKEGFLPQVEGKEEADFAALRMTCHAQFVENVGAPTKITAEGQLRFCRARLLRRAVEPFSLASTHRGDSRTNGRPQKAIPAQALKLGILRHVWTILFDKTNLTPAGVSYKVAL